MESFNLQFDLPVMGSMHAVRTPWGTIIPPGRRVVALLDNSGASIDIGNLQQISVCTTLAAALSKCQSGRGDYILAMPGHDESVAVTSMLDNLVDDTHVVGLGDPRRASAPKFTWDAADANWDVDDDNIAFENLRFEMNGANNIAEAISVSGAGVSFNNNWFVSGTGASADCLKVLDVESGADDFEFIGNKVYQSGGTTTSVLSFAAAVSRAVVANNFMSVLGTAVGNGAISISAAILDCLITRNQLINKTTNATACIDIADVAATGIVSHNLCGVVVSGTASGEGILLAGTSAVLLRFFENYCTDELGKSGLLTPGAAS